MRTYLKKFKSVLKNTRGKNYKKFKTSLRTLEKNKAIDFLENFLTGSEGATLAITKLWKFVRIYSEKTFGEYKTDLNKRTPLYWRQHGFSEKESYFICKKIKFNNPIHLVSPFSKEFWINKGMTEQDAIFKANSIRSIKKEYWMIRGFDEETSIELALKQKNSNNFNGVRSKFRISEQNKEYWMIRGFSVEESEKKVTERQITFSYDKCVEKFGEVEGAKIWQTRQDKWQKTLNDKPELEKSRINLEKNIFKIKNGEILENYFVRIKNSSNVFLKFDTVEDIYKHHLMVYETHKSYRHRYTPAEYINILPYSIQTCIDCKLFEIEAIHFYEKLDFIQTARGTQHQTPHGLLRSWNEINFYYRLVFYNIEFKIEKVYPNSKRRCDFFIPMFNEYIEIAGMMEIDKYKALMNFKKETYGSIILEFSDFDKYFKGLECKLK